MIKGLILYKIAISLLSVAFLLSYILISPLQKLAIKYDIIDCPSARKIHQLPTPLLGGVVIFISFFFTLILFYFNLSYQMFISGPTFFSFGANPLFWLKLGLYLICSVLIAIIGFLDDLKNLRFELKLIIQCLCALIMILGGVTLNVFHSSFLNHLFTLFWIIGFTNSFNLLDNMNGLSSGLFVIIISFFIYLTYISGQYLLTLFLIIPFGSVLGFFPHNFPKAKIFLGDTGSLFLGFSIAVYSIWIFDYLISSQQSPWLVFNSLILILFIPIIDTLTVICIRIKHHKPIYIGDNNHLSHQLVKSGCSAAIAVLILYLSSLLMGTFGVNLLK